MHERSKYLVMMEIMANFFSFEIIRMLLELFPPYYIFHEYFTRLFEKPLIFSLSFNTLFLILRTTPKLNYLRGRSASSSRKTFYPYRPIRGMLMLCFAPYHPSRKP